MLIQTTRFEQLYTMYKKNILLLLAISLFFLILPANLFAGYYEKGRSYYVYRNYAKAREMFIKATETSEHGDAYYFLGEIEKIEGNYEKAKEYYQTAITKKISKKFLRLAYWNLIVLTEQRGDYLGMVRSLKIFWERTGDGGAKRKVETLINKLMWSNNKKATETYKRGIKLKKKKQIEKALTLFKEATDHDSSFLSPKFEMALIDYHRGELSNAASYLNEIVNKIPFYGEVQLLLGDINFKKQNYRDAIENFDKAIEFGFMSKKTKYMIFFKRGTCLYNTGDYEDSRTDITAALKIRPGATSPLFLLSAILIKEENYKDALRTLHKLQKYNSKNSEIIYQIGSIYYKTGNDKYIAYFERLLGMVKGKKSDVPKKYFKAFVFLAKKYYESSRYTEVIATVKILPEESRDHNTSLITAKSYYRLENYKNAIHYFEKISLDDEERYLLCRAYAKTRMETKAKELLSSLYYSDTYFKKALDDSALKKIALEIEKEKSSSP